VRLRTLDSPLDKVMLQLTNFADEMERERARSRTYDAMVRKAKAGMSPADAHSVMTTSPSEAPLSRAKGSELSAFAVA
jgi:DNA invertase Pin-like site-specific DNA recombinase